MLKALVAGCPLWVCDYVFASFQAVPLHSSYQGKEGILVGFCVSVDCDASLKMPAIVTVGVNALAFVGFFLHSRIPATFMAWCPESLPIGVPDGEVVGMNLLSASTACLRYYPTLDPFPE